MLTWLLLYVLCFKYSTSEASQTKHHNTCTEIKKETQHLRSEDDGYYQTFIKLNADRFGYSISRPRVYIIMIRKCLDRTLRATFQMYVMSLVGILAAPQQTHHEEWHTLDGRLLNQFLRCMKSTVRIGWWFCPYPLVRDFFGLNSTCSWMKPPRDVAKQGIQSDEDLNRKCESVLERLMRQPVGSLSRPQSHSGFLRTLTRIGAQSASRRSWGQAFCCRTMHTCSMQWKSIPAHQSLESLQLICPGFNSFASQKLVTWHLTLLCKGKKAEETQVGQKALSEVQRIGGFKLSWASKKTMTLHDIYKSMCFSGRPKEAWDLPRKSTGHICAKGSTCTNLRQDRNSLIWSIFIFQNNKNISKHLSLS